MLRSWEIEDLNTLVLLIEPNARIKAPIKLLKLQPL
jgi:hypothetical protein